MTKQKILMDAESRKKLEGVVSHETELLLKYAKGIISDNIRIIAHIENKNSKNVSYIDIFRLSSDNSILKFLARRSENYYL